MAKIKIPEGVEDPAAFLAGGLGLAHRECEASDRAVGALGDKLQRAQDQVAEVKTQIREAKEAKDLADSHRADLEGALEKSDDDPAPAAGGQAPNATVKVS